ncbi:YdcF family protein [Actinokineospora sp. PR83]|uniref:YdcF family protein n=1 Tax=Actinokineospora sp. PR83 TaxID=2884908 RepID=UPI001F40A74E|nr:YdcF family protein [Actinokineospora sp. PR83]MCG8914550.1 YdcF family protein [Actinokineospora sp. PR83]
MLSLAAVLVAAHRVHREPRRFGNAVWSGVAVVLAGMWLLDALSGAAWLRVVVFVLFALVVLVLPWALIANGVVMWRREGHSLANLLSLLTGLAVLGLLVGTAAVVGFGGSRWLVVAATSLLLVAGYLAFLFLALLGYGALYGRLGARTRADAVIVLGAGLAGDRVPPLLANRLDRAIECRAHAADADPVVVVSGGRGSGELVSEAEAMGAYLREQGVPADRILLEDRATTTEQNLRNSMDLLTEHGRGGAVVAVTNNYHVFRTAVLSRRLGLPLDVVGAPTANYFVPSAFLREFVALLAQYRRTNAAAILVLAAVPPVLAVLAVA